MKRSLQRLLTPSVQTDGQMQSRRGYEVQKSAIKGHSALWNILNIMRTEEQTPDSYWCTRTRGLIQRSLESKTPREPIKYMSYCKNRSFKPGCLIKLWKDYFTLNSKRADELWGISKSSGTTWYLLKKCKLGPSRLFTPCSQASIRGLHFQDWLGLLSSALMNVVRDTLSRPGYVRTKSRLKVNLF